MRVVLVHNPRSGRARSAGEVARLHLSLSDAGRSVDAFELGPHIDHSALTAAARNAAAFIVAGGDGSVHHLAPLAAGVGVPLYHYPLGTENLFAREFGHAASPDLLLAALKSGRTGSADLASCNGRPFLLMASVGFDAHVVERVAAARTTGVRRADYARQAVCEFAEFRAPPLSITADGLPLAHEEPGLVIIANSRQYAARLNPCTEARIDDGLLEVLFLPYRSRPRLAAWLASVALGMHLHAPEARTARARAITIRSVATRVPHQLDGESVPAAPGTLDLDICVEPARLRVLLPPA